MIQKLLIFLFVVLHLGAKAQNFSLSSSFSSAQGAAQQEIASLVSIKNNSNRNLDLRWDIDRTNLPSGWSIQVCDKTCHTLEGKTVAFSLAPNETLNNFRVIFNPNGQEGIGNVEIQIYEAQNRTQTEISANFTASAQNSFSNNKTNPQRIYPNPAVEYIMLEDDDNVVKHLEIFNVMGRKIDEFVVSTSAQKFDVSNLPKGMYMVRMLDSQRAIIRTQRISKYNP
jgi:Secretion system C-terminal sorting domain